jgi:hypothetical protein
MRSSSPQGSIRAAGTAAASAQLTAGALLTLCEQVYDSFNSSQHTLDTHLHNSVQQLPQKLSADEECFIQEVGDSTALLFCRTYAWSMTCAGSNAAIEPLASLNSNQLPGSQAA